MKPSNKNAILSAMGAIVLAAPGSAEPLVRPGAKVALYGDSITENVRGYSKMVETYLTVCEPGVNPQVFQFGWGGETAKMLVDRLGRALAVFQPDLAAVFYGMNDGAYRQYDPAVGEAYRANLDAAVKKLTAPRPGEGCLCEGDLRVLGRVQ